MFPDLRYSLRLLRRNPGFTLVAALTLALGIGANTAIFTVVNGVLFRRLPFREPDRLVMVWATNQKRSNQHDVSSYPQFSDWRGQNHVFAGVAASAGLGANLTGVDEPERLSGLRVTANLFPLLGVTPALGRTFSAEEEQPGREKVVILSDGLWRRRLG